MRLEMKRVLLWWCTVLEDVKQQCSMQTGEEYIFELIINTKNQNMTDLCLDY